MTDTDYATRRLATALQNLAEIEDSDTRHTAQAMTATGDHAQAANRATAALSCDEYRAGLVRDAIEDVLDELDGDVSEVLTA